MSGFEDHSAYAQCIYAYSEGVGKEPKLFVGRLNGQIVSPRGINRFGYDTIFMPEGFKRTFAEITDEERKSIS